jgi:hypothetical protein
VLHTNTTRSPYSATLCHPFPNFEQTLIQKRQASHAVAAVSGTTSPPPLPRCPLPPPLRCHPPAGDGPAEAARRAPPMSVPASRRSAGGSGAPALPPRHRRAALRLPAAALRPPRTRLLPPLPPLRPCPGMHCCASYALVVRISRSSSSHFMRVHAAE